MGSASHNLATKLRLEPLGELGAQTACALLRAVVRGGRLHPGLAPEIRGPTVNTEKGERTPLHEVRELLAGVLGKRLPD